LKLRRPGKQNFTIRQVPQLPKLQGNKAQWFAALNYIAKLPSPIVDVKRSPPPPQWPPDLKGNRHQGWQLTIAASRTGAPRQPRPTSRTIYPQSSDVFRNQATCQALLIELGRDPTHPPITQRECDKLLKLLHALAEQAES
jgi:hypothetical protein